MAKRKISIAQLERDLVWLWNEPPNCHPGADEWTQSVAKDAQTVIRQLRAKLREARKETKRAPNHPRKQAG